MTDAGRLVPARPDVAVLVANGPLSGAAKPYLRERTARGGWLVGVDGGAARLHALGLVPHIVTGDFDSLSAEARDVLAAVGARIVPTPNQEYTDLDKALDYCIGTLGVHTAHVFGATGGRLDHTYSALSAVLKHGRRADVCLVDEVADTWLLNGEATLTGPGLPGRIVSLMAFGIVTDIWTEGLRWPLRGESLAPGVRDGTLNEIVAETVTLRAGSGDLLVMLHHGMAPPAGDVRPRPKGGSIPAPPLLGAGGSIP